MRSILVMSLAAATLVGCGQTRLLTGPATGPAACGPAAVTGQLITAGDVGLALLRGDGRTVRIVWPFGYTARRELLRVILVSPQETDWRVTAMWWSLGVGVPPTAAASGRSAHQTQYTS
jgi:hypothetical protein